MEEGNQEAEESEKSFWRKKLDMLRHISGLTRFDMIAQVLAWLFFCHWIIYFPICAVFYYTFLGNTIRSFIISSVTDGKHTNLRFYVALFIDDQSFPET